MILLMQLHQIQYLAHPPQPKYLYDTSVPACQATGTEIEGITCLIEALVLL